MPDLEELRKAAREYLEDTSNKDNVFYEALHRFAEIGDDLAYKTLAKLLTEL